MRCRPVQATTSCYFALEMGHPTILAMTDVFWSQCQPPPSCPGPYSYPPPRSEGEELRLVCAFRLRHRDLQKSAFCLSSLPRASAQAISRYCPQENRRAISLPNEAHATLFAWALSPYCAGRTVQELAEAGARSAFRHFAREPPVLLQPPCQYQQTEPLGNRR